MKEILLWRTYLPYLSYVVFTEIDQVSLQAKAIQSDLQNI